MGDYKAESYGIYDGEQTLTKAQYEKVRIDNPERQTSPVSFDIPTSTRGRF